MANDYSQRRDQIAAALRGLLKLPAGRSIRRFTHGWTTYQGKRGYYVGYTWMRTHANHMTGMVYETTIARGATFEDALAAAVRKLTITPED